MDKQLKDALKSLLSDIDAMRCPAPETIIDEESDLDHWFGAFSFCHYDDGGDGYVQWPNLSILASKLQDLLAPDKVVIGRPLDQ